MGSIPPQDNRLCEPRTADVSLVVIYAYDPIHSSARVNKLSFQNYPISVKKTSFQIQPNVPLHYFYINYITLPTSINV